MDTISSKLLKTIANEISPFTFVYCGHLKIFLLLPDLKIW